MYVETGSSSYFHTVLVLRDDDEVLSTSGGVGEWLGRALGRDND